MTTVVRSGLIVRCRFYALVGLLSLRQFPVHGERNENKHAISKAYRMGSILWLAGLELDRRLNPAWLCLLSSKLQSFVSDHQPKSGARAGATSASPETSKRTSTNLRKPASSRCP